MSEILPRVGRFVKQFALVLWYHWVLSIKPCLINKLSGRGPQMATSQAIDKKPPAMNFNTGHARFTIPGIRTLEDERAKQGGEIQERFRLILAPYPPTIPFPRLSGDARMSHGPTRSRSLLPRYSDLSLAAIIATAGVVFFSGHFTTVRFDRERIEVQIERGRIHVKGLYHYTNASGLPAVLTLGVPFPVDSNHPQPEWFALYESGEDGRAGAEIVPVVRGSDVSFRLIFRPYEAKWILLEYSQPSHVPRGRYLLTTTRPWRRPIERADYVLRIPHESSLLSSNYPVTSEPAAAGWQAFTFSKTDFFPDRDWEFAWDDSRAQAAIGTGVRP